MANRNGTSGGRAPKKKGLIGAVERHPIRTAGIAAGALVGLTLLCKAACGSDSDHGDAAERDGAARTTAGRARARRASPRATSRGGRAAARARGGRSQTRAETGRSE